MAHMRSDHFALSHVDDPDEAGQPLTVVTLRKVRFTHIPLILTATEIAELTELLNRWSDAGDWPLIVRHSAPELSGN